jgi:protein SCO1/2
LRAFGRRGRKERFVRLTRSNANKARPRPSARSLAVIVAVVALFGAGVAIVATPGRSPPDLIGGPFTLTAADGKTLTDADLKGRPFLVYFGYTHCPDVCPTTLAEISDALRRMPDKPIRALFVTVDPERDTPAAMGDYVSSFDPRIIGLSGSPEEIAAIEKGYRVYARKGPPRADGDYSMDHSSVVYLMDKNGAFVETLNLERPRDEVAKELAAYF